MPASADYPPGTTVNDRYELKERLGRDGSVYKAHDRHLDKDFAIKFLHPDGNQAQSWREAQRLEHLRSRFLVDVINADVVVASDIRYIVTPILSGGDLEKAAAAIGLGVKTSVRYSQQIASGIDRIHAAGMVHRDIKPANVLREQHEVVVSDLGFCEITDEQGRAERNGSWCTLAPETAVEDGYCSVTSDVYSLAATTFYLLSGQYPVDHTLHPAEQRALIERGELRELRDLAPHVSRAIGAVVRRGLSPDPVNRYASALDYANALVGAARSGRDWGRVAHPGHLHCLVGAAYKGRTGVTICVTDAGPRVHVAVRHLDTGRRVRDFGDQHVPPGRLTKVLQRLVADLG